jgi:hypothetical protein
VKRIELKYVLVIYIYISRWHNKTLQTLLKRKKGKMREEATGV